MSNHIVKLSDKELYLVWTIVCWFDKPVTSGLKYKLSGMSRSELRSGLEKRYDRAIEDRIIELGKWLADKRAKESVPAPPKEESI